MGIRGLQKFLDENLGILKDFQLHDCNVLLDGNSIYHQIYKQTGLTCLFAGEYDRFAEHCRHFFRSLQVCRINSIVVFDGARLDDRKLGTTLDRSKKRVRFSTEMSVNVDLSPALIRQVFQAVLDEFQVPYVSSLAEADDQSVSLANHLDCFLIATDSDYFCYSIDRGYIPFDFLHVEPTEKDGIVFLPCRLFNVELLFERFPGLNPTSLAISCAICGNDYLSSSTTEQIFQHIVRTSPKSSQHRKKLQTRHSIVFNWASNFNDEDSLFQAIFLVIRTANEQKKIENQLRQAIEFYLHPADTLIYHFASKENLILRRNSVFNDRAEQFFQQNSLTDDEITNKLKVDVKTFNGRDLPQYLIDGLTNSKMFESFLEVLVHRRLICSAYVELERELSVHEHSIPIILPCLSMLIESDGNEDEEQTFYVYHRVVRNLKRCIFPILTENRFPTIKQMRKLSVEQLETLISAQLEISDEKLEKIDRLHEDFRLWFRIFSHWFKVRQVKPVYLYGIIVSFVRSVYLKSSEQPSDVNSEYIEPFSQSIDDERNRILLSADDFTSIKTKIRNMMRDVYLAKQFNCRIIHEFNSLQMIYLYTLKLNDFLGQPFSLSLDVGTFLSGSFFYAFVNNYAKKSNHYDAVFHFLNSNRTIMEIVENFVQLISSD